MKLLELLTRIDRSEKNTDRGVVYELAGNCFDEWDFYTELNSDDIVLTRHWLSPIYDSNTYVGISAIYLNDDLVGMTQNTGRKSDTLYSWISKKTYEDTLAYVQQINAHQDEPCITVIKDKDMPDEGYGVFYPSQLMSDTVLLKGTKELATVTKESRKLGNSTVDVCLSDGSVRAINLRQDAVIPYRLAGEAL